MSFGWQRYDNDDDVGDDDDHNDDVRRRWLIIIMAIGFTMKLFFAFILTVSFTNRTSNLLSDPNLSKRDNQGI